MAVAVLARWVLMVHQVLLVMVAQELHHQYQVHLLLMRVAVAAELLLELLEVVALVAEVLVLALLMEQQEPQILEAVAVEQIIILMAVLVVQELS